MPSAIAEIPLPLGLRHGARRKLCSRCAGTAGCLRRAAFGDPTVEFVAVEKIVGAIDEGRRSAIFKLEKRKAVAFGRPCGVENSDIGAHASNQAAADQTDDLDLMTDLI